MNNKHAALSTSTSPSTVGATLNAVICCFASISSRRLRELTVAWVPSDKSTVKKLCQIKAVFSSGIGPIDFLQLLPGCRLKCVNGGDQWLASL